MNKRSVDLHVPKKIAIIITASFSVLSILVYVLSLLATNGAFGRLHTLWQSDYVYSGNVQSPLSLDCYYQLNAGISMSLSADVNSSLNVDVIMQSETANYTNNLSWNTDTLGKNEIAITKGVADANSLVPGDKLYSKHVVNGSKIAYVIKSILSEATTTNETENRFSDGIIVMGYDEEYISNVSHTIIAYVNGSVQDTVQEGVQTPVNITYRSDEIIVVMKELLPYCVLFLFGGIIVAIGFVFFLSKEALANIRRLTILGTDCRRIDYSYRRLLYGSGSIALALALMISITLAIILKCCILSMASLFVLLLVQFLGIHCSLVIAHKDFGRS